MLWGILHSFSSIQTIDHKPDYDKGRHSGWYCMALSLSLLEKYSCRLASWSSCVSFQESFVQLFTELKYRRSRPLWLDALWISVSIKVLFTITMLHSSHSHCWCRPSNCSYLVLHTGIHTMLFHTASYSTSFRHTLTFIVTFIDLT